MASGDAPAGGEAAAEAGRLKVFISYSRRDVQFADELELALSSRGFEALVDRHDIDAGEEWQKRLGELLTACDTVIFVLTETSSKSPICAWEVKEASRLGKRRLVVAPGAVPPGVSAPPELAGINWIHCWRNPDIPGSSFVRGVVELERALKVDLSWLRQQTLLQEQAGRWNARARAADSPILLRGDLLEEALAWARKAPAGANVVEDVAAFLAASEAHEARLKAEAAAGIAEREAALKAAQLAAEKQKRAERGLRRLGVFALALGVILSAAAVVGGWFAVKESLGAFDLRAQLFSAESRRVAETGDHARAMTIALAGDVTSEQSGPAPSLFRSSGNGPTAAAAVRAFSENRLIATLKGRSAAIVALSVALDGKSILVGYGDGGIARIPLARAPTLADPIPVPIVEPINQYAKAVAFSPNQETVLVGDGGALLAFDLRTGKPGPDFKASGRPGFRAHDAWIQSIAFSPDGKLIATSSEDKTAKVWTADGELVATFKHDDWVQSAAFAPGDSVVTLDLKGRVTDWSIASGKQLSSFDSGTFNGLALPTLAAVYLDSSKVMVLAGSQDSTARLWRLKDIDEEVVTVIGDNEPYPEGILLGHRGAVQFVAASPDGETVITGSSDGTAKLWRGPYPYYGYLVATLAGHSGEVRAAAYSADSKIVVTGAMDGTIKVWLADPGGADPGVDLLTMSETGQITDAAISPDGRSLVKSTWRTVGERRESDLFGGYVLSLSNGEPTGRFEGHTEGITKFAFSPDGKRVLSGSSDGSARLWSPADGKEIARFIHEASVHAVAYAPDGGSVAVGSTDGVVKVYRLTPDEPSGGKEVAAFKSDQGVFALAYAPNGKTIVAGYAGGSAKMWPAAGGKELRTFEGKGSTIHSIAFSPDGQTFAAGFGDGSAKLWESNGGAQPVSFYGHRSLVWSVAFAPAAANGPFGKYLLLTGSSDGVAKLWSMDGSLLANYAIRGDQVQAAAFSPDGKSVIAASYQGGVRKWDLSPLLFRSAREQLKIACDQLRSIGVTRLAEADYQRFPVLDRNAPHPCETAWLTPPLRLPDPTPDMAPQWATCRREGDDAAARVNSCTAIIDSGTSKDARLAAAYFNRAQGRKELGAGEDAIADYTSALKLDTENASFFAARGGAYLDGGKFDLAVADFSEALARTPRLLDNERYERLNERCWARAVAGTDLGMALQDCNESLALRPDNAFVRAYVLDSRGLVYFKLGKLEEALKDYDEALVGQAAASTLYARGVVRMRLGRTAEGRADLDKATRMDKDVALSAAGYGIKP